MESNRMLKDVKDSPKDLGYEDETVEDRKAKGKRLKEMTIKLIVEAVAELNARSALKPIEKKIKVHKK